MAEHLFPIICPLQFRKQNIYENTFNLFCVYGNPNYKYVYLKKIGKILHEMTIYTSDIFLNLVIFQFQDFKVRNLNNLKLLATLVKYLILTYFIEISFQFKMISIVRT